MTEEQKKEYIDMLDYFSGIGINAVMFQIRPAADAFYESDIEPWSEWLTGKQGKAPEPYYDPLKFYIEEAHKREGIIQSRCSFFCEYDREASGKI